MAHPLGVPLLIANPSAGRRTGDVLGRLRAALSARSIDHDLVTTNRRGHATEVTRNAVERDGRTYLVAVGGDGTVHEVVNGLVDTAAGTLRGADPVLGVVGNGSGCDFVRTFGLDRSPELLADHLATDATMHVDLGRVEVAAADGERRTRHVFANIAEVGFGAEVVARSARLPRRLGPSRYAVGVVATWGRFRRIPMTVTVDGSTRTEAVCNVIVANGQFYGGGLMVAPRAIPNDGRYNVQTWGGTPTDVIRFTKLLRTGRHLSRSDVREWQSQRVTVETSRPARVEADGELLGRSPAGFDILPGILRLKL